MKPYPILAVIAALLFSAIPAFAMDGNVLWLPFDNNLTDASGNSLNGYDGRVDFMTQHDYNYASIAHEETAHSGYLYFNYTKPSFAIRSGSSWQAEYDFYDEGPILSNYTIPEGCWNQDVLQFRFTSTTSYGPSISGDCWDGSSWSNLFYRSGGAGYVADNITNSQPDLAYDGDWGTGVSCAQDNTLGVCGWIRIPSARHEQLNEQAMNWHIQSPEVSYVAGKFGQAISLNNEYNNYVGVLNDPLIDFGYDAFSVSFWIKYPDTLNTGGAGVLQKYQENDDTGFYQGWTMEVLGGDHEGNVRIDTNSMDEEFGIAAFTTTSINDDSWHFIVATKNDTDLSIYVDGVYEDGDYYGNLNHYAAPANISSYNDLILGSYSSGQVPPQSYFFAGNMDDFRLWNRELTATEVYNLYAYNSLEAPPPPPPTAAQVFKPIIILVLAAAICVFVYNRLKEGDLEVKAMISLLIGTAIAISALIVVGMMIP